MKRIYEEKTVDGVRILVDRLWPRGISKENAALDFWPKELTPSTELRKAYHEEVLTYEEFQSSYWEELQRIPLQEDLMEKWRSLLKEKDLILLSSVKDLEKSHVPVLKRFLEMRLGETQKD
ncbi:DUF488 domain-containing protein [Proteiniclasticum ruminis]|nr:DUF488 family protein [Proteiniclasticum ruminis]